MSVEGLSENLNIIQDLVIPGLDTDLDVIQSLDDEPNDVGGLTAAELKGKFDQSGNAIKNYINNTLLPAISDTVAEEAVRAEAETTRQTQETARQTAESGRASAEQSRVSAEGVRQAQESARGTAEQARASAETAREQTEVARVSAEQARMSAESARVLAETARESSMQQVESALESAEQGRVTAEQGRVSAEAARNVWENYSNSKRYVPGNKVAYGGSSYVCTAPTAGNAPADTAYWTLIAAKGQDGQGVGDMLSATYDPAGRAQDVFAYADAAEAAAKAASRPSTWMPSASEVGAAPSSHTHPASDLTTAVPVAKGGTGASTAEGARKNLGACALVAPVTVTLAVASWAGSGPWTQTVTVSGVTASDNHIGVFPVDVADNDARKLYEKAYGCLAAEAETVAGGVKFTCRDKKPETAFQVIIKGVR